jgi:hypothetical protein
MLGWFGIFGRSHEIQTLERALRALGHHPALVSDAVKLTTIKQLKAAAGGQTPGQAAIESAAALLAYCAMGREAYAENNGWRATETAEDRIVAAFERGVGIDEKLVLLALTAQMVHPSVRERFDLKME